MNATNAINATDMTASDNAGRVFFTVYNVTRAMVPGISIENAQDDASAVAFGASERLCHAFDDAARDA